MPKIKRNGNGDLVLDKSMKISLGVVILIIAAITSCVGYAVAQCQVIDSHIADGNIHWGKTTLDEAYMPRPEIAAELSAIRAQLTRIENSL